MRETEGESGVVSDRPMVIVTVQRSSEIIPFAIFYCEDVAIRDDGLLIVLEDQEIILEDYDFFNVYEDTPEALVGAIKRFDATLNCADAKPPSWESEWEAYLARRKVVHQGRLNLEDLSWRDCFGEGWKARDARIAELEDAVYAIAGAYKSRYPTADAMVDALQGIARRSISRGEVNRGSR